MQLARSMCAKLHRLSDITCSQQPGHPKECLRHIAVSFLFAQPRPIAQGTIWKIITLPVLFIGPVLINAGDAVIIQIEHGFQKGAFGIG